MLDIQTTNPELVQSASNLADSEAWKELHATYHPPLVRHCLRSGLCSAEAEDTASVVIATLARRLSRSPLQWTRTSLRGWLSETANRHIFEVHKNRRRDLLSAEAMRLIQEWLPPAFAPGEDVEAREQLERHLWSVCLARVRAMVPAKRWQIFEAYALNGQTSSEVARIFNTSAFNVRINRYRMISRIRDEWKSLANQQIDLPE